MKPGTTCSRILRKHVRLNLPTVTYRYIAIRWKVSLVQSVQQFIFKYNCGWHVISTSKNNNCFSFLFWADSVYIFLAFLANSVPSSRFLLETQFVCVKYSALVLRTNQAIFLLRILKNAPTWDSPITNTLLRDRVPPLWTVSLGRSFKISLHSETLTA
jgi:hypothetical protein